MDIDKKENHDDFYLNWAKQNGKFNNIDYFSYLPLVYICIAVVLCFSLIRLWI